MLLATLAPIQTETQDQRSTEAEFAALEARRFPAVTGAGLPTLERLLSDDLAHTHASGWRQTKLSSCPRCAQAN